MLHFSAVNINSIKKYEKYFSNRKEVPAYYGEGTINYGNDTSTKYQFTLEECKNNSIIGITPEPGLKYKQENVNTPHSLTYEVSNDLLETQKENLKPTKFSTQISKDFWKEDFTADQKKLFSKEISEIYNTVKALENQKTFNSQLHGIYIA